MKEKPLRLELTDLGWKQCTAEFGASVPVGVRAGAGGAALYAVLGVIKRHLDRTDLPYQDFFASAAPKQTAPTPQEVEARIRTAYAGTGARAGGLGHAGCPP